MPQVIEQTISKTGIQNQVVLKKKKNDMLILQNHSVEGQARLNFFLKQVRITKIQEYAESVMASNQGKAALERDRNSIIGRK